MRRLTSLVLSLALGLAPMSGRVARADPTAAELTVARELFEGGLADENKGEWQKALDKFRKVVAVKATPQVRFHIALCLENTGKLVDAYNDFQRVQSDTAGVSKGDVATVNANSTKHVNDLKERIPRVVIQVPNGVDDASVTIDGKKVTASLVGTPIPLDPGWHKIAVTAGKGTYEKNVNLVEKGAPVTVSVTFAAEKPTEIETPKKDEPPPARDTGGPGALPFVVGGIGIAAMVGGGVFYMMGRSNLNQVKDGCPDLVNCSPDLEDAYNKGKSQNTAGSILLIGGAVLTVVGVVILIASPSSSSSETKSAKKGLSISLGPAPTPLGFGLMGAF